MTRVLPPARSKLRVLRAGDAIAHWRLLEASGTALADAAGLSALVSTTAGNIVDGPFYGEGAGNKGRVFASGTRATGASTGAQRSALLAGDWTIEAWIKPTSVAGVNAIIALGSSAAGEANNYLASLRIDGATFGAVWQRTASKTAVTALTASGPVTLDEVQHLVARCRATGGTRAVDLLRNGVLVETITGLLPPTGGASSAWEMGALPVSHGSPFDGDIYDVRVAAIALSDEAIRESYSRGVRDWDLARAIDSRQYTTHRRALIHNGDAGWVDLSSHYEINWLKGSEDSETVDDDGASGKLSLRRRSEFLSVAPFITGARPNVESPVGQLLDVARRIKLEECIVPHGASVDVIAGVHWGLVFEGFVRAVSGGDTHELTLADNMYALQIAWAQPNRSTSPDTDFRYAATPTAIEAVLTQMLTDHEPTSIGGTVEGYVGGVDVGLFAPTSPLFVIDNTGTGSDPGGFTVTSSRSVAAALTDTVDTTIAWFLRYMWDDTRQAFRLTLADPGRAKTFDALTDRTLQPWQIIGDWKRVEIDDGDVRNDIEIEWSGPATRDNVGVNSRAMFRIENLTSIARFGRRYCRVGLATGSQISTLAQVTNLATMMLADLAFPFADIEIETLPRRDIGIGDVVRLAADGINTDVDIDVAVVGVQHNRKGRGSTTFTCRQAAPIGRRARWFDWIVQTGINDGRGLTPPPTPAVPTLFTVPGGLVVGWQPPANFGSRRYRETEIHAGATAGFAPSPSTRIAVVRGGKAASLDLAPGVETYIRLIHRDDMDNTSAPSLSAKATPRQLPRTAHARVRRSANQVVTASTITVVAFDVEDVDPLSRHSAGSYTALTDGLVDVDVRLLCDSAAKPDAPCRVYIYVAGVVRVVGDTFLTNSGAAPNRVQLAMRAAVQVSAGQVVDVRVYIEGNSGSAVVVNSLNTRAWLTPTTED